MNKMLVKIHKSYRNVVAICDSDLIGKKFEEKDLQLDLTTEFFKGDETSESEVLEIIESAVLEDSSFNIVGKESVACALKAGIVDKKSIKKIQGIPVALTLL
tara:strand:- start:151 stop:456 length:306 start_codon:yes stop_codon:yes gene_type:complete